MTDRDADKEHTDKTRTVEPTEDRSEAASVSAEENTKFTDQSVYAASLHYRQSHFPPLSEMKGYERLQPGSWDRILTMVEKEQQAQIHLNQAILDFNKADQNRRQWLGAAISVVALIAAAVIGYSHADWRIAVALVGVPVLAVAKALVDSARGLRDHVEK